MEGPGGLIGTLDFFLGEMKSHWIILIGEVTVFKGLNVE
jgi:hypothetical protein